MSALGTDGLCRSRGGAGAVSVGCRGIQLNLVAQFRQQLVEWRGGRLIRPYGCCRVQAGGLPDPGQHGHRNWLAKVAEHESGEQIAEVVGIGGLTGACRGPLVPDGVPDDVPGRFLVPPPLWRLVEAQPVSVLPASADKKS